MAGLAAVPSIVSGIVNAGQSILSGSQLEKDKAELARLEQPFYKIQDEYYGNVNQAAELAQGGLTQQSKDFYSDMASRGLGSSLSALTSLGGNPNAVASVFDAYNTGIRQLGAEDSERQIANIKYFQNTAKDLAGQKTTQWAINELKPYENKLKELTQRIAADKNNIWNGIQGVIGAGQAAVTASQNEDLINNLFKESTTTGVPGTNAGVAGAVTNLLSDPFLKPVIPTSEDQVQRPPADPSDVENMTQDQALQQLLIKIAPLFNKLKT